MEELEKKIKKHMENQDIDYLFFSQLWKIEDEKEKEEIELLFANYVLKLVTSGTRKNSENRRVLDNLNNYDVLKTMKKYGIFGRVYCRIYNGKLLFNYCAGQDYPSEKRIMRNLIVKN